MKRTILVVLILCLAWSLCACTHSKPSLPEDTNSTSKFETSKPSGVSPSENESSQESSEMEEEPEMGTCTLTFSTFSGGGYDYTAVIEDPEILTYTVVYDFGAQSDEPIDGASYDVVFSFTGLKPGTTKLTIQCSSPIADNHELYYTVNVDASLEVMVSEFRTISRFFLSRYGDEVDDYYVLERSEGECLLSIDGENFQTVDPAVMDALYEVYETYHVDDWDGFLESDTALDGEQFMLEVYLSDGTFIRAAGDFVYPEHYQEVMQAWAAILHPIFLVE